MGRAAKWFRGLFGGQKGSSGVPAAEPKPGKEKKRWGFGKSFREKERRGEPHPPPFAAGNAAFEERKGSYRETAAEDENEQNKRAIAVAAATAAVAEAAVAAAQAAAAVVRLTSSGRCVVGGGKREEAAAVKIQAAFRGYLARRALKALKGLVKLQALVRGNIVRKQAAETLRCMHALVRVQARARACRALRSEKHQSSRLHPGPPTPEKYEQAIRSNAPKPDRSSPLKRNSSKPSNNNYSSDRDGARSSGWNWLDRWMEERYWDSRESTKSGVAVSPAASAPLDDEKNAKILEIDPGKPQYNQRRKSSHLQSSCFSDPNSRSFTTLPDSPSKDSTIAQRSIPSPSSVGMQESLSPLRFPIIDNGDLGESPQFFSASSRPGSSRRGPFTPTKSECSRSLFSGFSDYPNYMANTESSKAKVVRSQSAPKQRPEFEKSGSIRRVSGHGSGQQSAHRLSSTLHAKFANNKAYPGSGRLDRLGMPLRI